MALDNAALLEVLEAMQAAGVEDRVRTASITFGSAPHVALAAGGPTCDSSALLARFDLLCEVDRDVGGKDACFHD